MMWKTRMMRVLQLLKQASMHRCSVSFFLFYRLSMNFCARSEEQALKPDS
jgi:hypothetical protein